MKKRISILAIFLVVGAVLALMLSAQDVLGAYLFNSTFTTGMDGWDVGQWGGAATWTTADGRLCVTVTNPGANPWELSIYRRGITLEPGHSYTVSFDVTASQEATIQAHIQHNGAPYTQYWQKTGLVVNTTPQTISENFTNNEAAVDTNVEFPIQVGAGSGNTVPAGTTICLDNIALDDPQYNPAPIPTIYPVAVNQVGYGVNSPKIATFRTDAAEPLPWQVKDSGGSVVLSGNAAGPASADAASGNSVQKIDLSALKTAGSGYTLEVTRPGAVLASGVFDTDLAPWSTWFSAPAAGTAAVVNGEACLDITAGGAKTWDIGMNFQQFTMKKGQTYEVSFKSHASAPNQMRVKIGEVGGSWAEYWSSTVNLTAEAQTTQGTFTLASDPPAQATFDFNFGGPLAVTAPYTVCLDDIRFAEVPQVETSHPFAVATGLYSSLMKDALRYFYYSRSGMDITMPFAADAKWARPAGIMDTSVGCVPDNPNCTATYTLDVHKGWFDAGDYGKYVVNGGIAAWTLMNQYERTVFWGKWSSLSDNTNIPESGNHIPDVLDESRWEMEFMLSMQVPAGNPQAGMVHHKIHDITWGPMPQLPQDDTAARYLHPVSTGATLNLAATAAQCARVWAIYDPKFAFRCLKAAETAWNAAQKYPDILADPADGSGGGTYADGDVSDEFYWAAAELYATTGKPVYMQYLKKSPYYLKISTAAQGQTGQESSMYWGQTDALGTITLAVVPNRLPATAVRTARKNIVAAADTYLGIVNGQGYGVPMTPGSGNGYPWGSNSNMLNNAMVMALARDFTGKPAYLGGVVQVMDYLLGRNPLDKSYISGYGANPLLHPHHRFWGNEVIGDITYPEPPPGVVAGGPDSSLEDPLAVATLAGCVYQTCYIDGRDSYSTNEVTINWNAPLAWVAAYLNEQFVK